MTREDSNGIMLPSPKAIIIIEEIKTQKENASSAADHWLKVKRVILPE